MYTYSCLHTYTYIMYIVKKIFKNQNCFAWLNEKTPLFWCWALVAAGVSSLCCSFSALHLPHLRRSQSVLCGPLVTGRSVQATADVRLCLRGSSCDRLRSIWADSFLKHLLGFVCCALFSVSVVSVCVRHTYVTARMLRQRWEDNFRSRLSPPSGMQRQTQVWGVEASVFSHGAIMSALAGWCCDHFLKVKTRPCFAAACYVQSRKVHWVFRTHSNITAPAL